MASPTTPSSGYAAQGTEATTMIWGTDGLYSGYTVLAFNQKLDQETIHLTNGTGIKTNRIQLKNGAMWEMTVRDNYTVSPPQYGAVVTVTDAGGLLSTTRTSTYAGRVVDASWDVAPKQAGERKITVEYLTLVDA